jgi:hypothetical protein
MELMLRLPTITLTVVLLTLTWIVSFRRNSLLRSGGKDQLGEGIRRFALRSATRGPVDLTEVCVDAALKARSNPLGPKAAKSPLLSYKRVQGGFEGAWMVRRSR